MRRVFPRRLSGSSACGDDQRSEILLHLMGLTSELSPGRSHLAGKRRTDPVVRLSFIVKLNFLNSLSVPLNSMPTASRRAVVTTVVSVSRKRSLVQM